MKIYIAGPDLFYPDWPHVHTFLIKEKPMSEEGEGCIFVDGMADTDTRDKLIELVKDRLGPGELIPFIALDGLSDVEADHYLE